MSEHIIQVDFRASFITPMQADTLWGHLCWALRYRYGEKELSDFLASYADDTTPLVLSNALPEGCLPQPLLPPMEKPAQMDLVLRYWEKKEISHGAATIGALAKLPYLPIPLLGSINGAPLSSQGLHARIISAPDICLATAALLPAPCPLKFKSNQKIACRPLTNYPDKCPVVPYQAMQPGQPSQGVVMRTAVSRITGSAMTGRLFPTIEYIPDTPRYEVYCRIHPPFSEEMMKDCLAFISDTGFGKRKSSGKGQVDCTLKAPKLTGTDPAANAFMSLSNFVPKAGDPMTGYYSTLTKYGKLGGHFASSPVDGSKEVLPYKYPLVMLAAGSVFLAGKTPAGVYGRIVEGVHPCMPQIVHYGLAYPWPIRVEV